MGALQRYQIVATACRVCPALIAIMILDTSMLSIMNCTSISYCTVCMLFYQLDASLRCGESRFLEKLRIYRSTMWVAAVEWAVGAEINRIKYRVFSNSDGE